MRITLVLLTQRRNFLFAVSPSPSEIRKVHNLRAGFLPIISFYVSCAWFFRFLARSTFSPYLANFASYGKCFISYTISALKCNALKCKMLCKCNALQMIRKKSVFVNLIFWEGIFCFRWVVNFKKNFSLFFWNRSTWFFDDQCKYLFSTW